MPPEDQRDYELGYGKPPRHTRFKKGQSGNPQGKSADWAMETFALARVDAYGLLPAPSGQSTYSLPPAYVDQAVRDVALQLSRACLRRARVIAVQ